MPWFGFLAYTLTKAGDSDEDAPATAT